MSESELELDSDQEQEHKYESRNYHKLLQLQQYNNNPTNVIYHNNNNNISSTFHLKNYHKRFTQPITAIESTTKHHSSNINDVNQHTTTTNYPYNLPMSRIRKKFTISNTKALIHDRHNKKLKTNNIRNRSFIIDAMSQNELKLRDSIRNRTLHDQEQQQQSMYYLLSYAT